jgi:Undecaprenyl-phosphate galactose phosphotransferase WbaP
LSTPRPNKAASSRSSSGSARSLPSRPHLVSPIGKRTSADSANQTPAGENTTEFGLGPAHSVDPHGWPVPARCLASADSSRSLRSLAKRAIDVAGALLLGLVFSPLILAIVLFMRRDGGPVIYRHRRIGRDGRPFDCLKFRTMVPNADQVLRNLLEHDPELKAEWARDHKLRHDPRVTPIGAFLRRTSLDELPQIWNVLRGEMSLVGPRPVVREELMRYGRNVWAYFAAKPGLTGLWQVNGRNDTSYRRRVVLDTYYVRNQSFLLDLYILLKTTRVVVGGSGAY